MNMIKIAFFVEGYTEEEFLTRMLFQVFGIKKIGIERIKIRGGSKSPISYTTLATPDVSESFQYYILIFNCGGDAAIRSHMLDRRGSLISAGYRKIIGFRDVFPIVRSEIHKLKYGLYYKIPQTKISISFVLSVMEVESWFLADEFHYLRIDDRLTNEFILKKFGFDPRVYNTELIENPANLLKLIYGSVGKTYRKEKRIIDRTIGELDFANLYINSSLRISSLKELTDEIDLLFEM